jgi:IS66 C-terminal element
MTSDQKRWRSGYDARCCGDGRNVDPRAWLADALARIGDHLASRLDELLPWHRSHAQETRSLAT